MKKADQTSGPLTKSADKSDFIRGGAAKINEKPDNNSCNISCYQLSNRFQPNFKHENSI